MFIRRVAQIWVGGLCVVLSRFIKDASNARSYLVPALLPGLLLLPLLLNFSSGDAQESDWTPAWVDFGTTAVINIVDLETAPARGPARPTLPTAVSRFYSWLAPPGTLHADLTGEWETIFSDDFEGTFPGEWHVYDEDGPTYGEYLWAQSDCRPHTGSYSAWAVGGGADGETLTCGSHYPHNAQSGMVYGPFGLEDAAAAELVLQYWLNTEPMVDLLFVGASIDGSAFYGAVTSGTQPWTEYRFDLADVYTLGNLMDEAEVWVMIGFISNGSVSLAEGAYVDDIVIQKYVEVEPTPTVSPSPTPTATVTPSPAPIPEGRILYLPLVMRHWPFTPEAPILNPIDNPDGTGSYTLSWNGVEGAETYTLQEARDATFTDPTTVYSGPNTSIGISRRDVGTYTYRVRASNAYATSAWSNTRSVVVTVAPQPDEWTIATIPSETQRGHSSIAVDQDGHPHISFMDASDVAVKYGRWNGQSWEVQIIETIDHYSRASTALALAQDDRRHIAYEYNNPIRITHVEWDEDHRTSRRFSREQLPCILHLDLALKPNGDPCISCYEPVLYGLDKIVVACRTGTAWQITAGVPVSFGNRLVETAVRFSHALAVDNEGFPHISLLRWKSDESQTLWYAVGSTEGWFISEVDAEAARVGFYPSLALDSHDRAHISYYDGTNGTLKYARWSGSQWLIERVDSAGDVGGTTSLALDEFGNAHISYYDVSNSNLKYAVWDGSQWHIETVDSSGAVGEWSSLALDAAGHVHVSYYDHTNGNLKYATNSGAFGR